MATYRVFLVGREGHFEGVRILEGCDSDEDAIAAAESYLTARAVQVWNLDRLVATLRLEGGQLIKEP